MELEPLQAELADDVVAVERLAGIVEDPERVLAGALQEEVERLEPVAGEVLALVDDDRVEALARERVDRVLFAVSHSAQDVPSSWRVAPRFRTVPSEDRHCWHSAPT